MTEKNSLKPHSTCDPPRRILFCVRSDNERAIDAAFECFESFGDNANVAIYVEEASETLAQEPILPTDSERPDLVVVFGGDGTGLKFANRFSEVSILPINAGTVGFLSEVECPDAAGAIRAALSGNCFLESHRMLRAAVDGADSKEYYAINDITLTIAHPGKLIALEVKVDGQRVYTMRGDGIIVSTSLGSSAYSLSAGGSVIHPSLDAVTVVPICPFMSTVVPLVLTADHEITLVNHSVFREAQVSVDGRMLGRLTGKDSLVVSLARREVRFVRFTDSYFARLTTKLLRNQEWLSG